MKINQIENMADALLRFNDKYDTTLKEDCLTIADIMYDAGLNLWVSTKEQKPELYTSVLGYSWNDHYRVCWLDEDNDWHTENTAYDFEEITHWMPLPEPPKN